MRTSEAKALVAVLKASFPRQPVAEDTIRVYVDMLGDLDADTAAAAVKRLIATSRFFPTIAEIREEVAKATANVATLPSASEAWGIVLGEVRRRGYWQSPEFERRELYLALEAIGGWHYLCQQSRDAMVSERSRFIDAYRTIRDRTVRGEQLGEHRPVLPGGRDAQRIAKPKGEAPALDQVIDLGKALKSEPKARHEQTALVSGSEADPLRGYPRAGKTAGRAGEAPLREREGREGDE